MKTCCTLFLLLFSFACHAQSYFPFPKNEASWQVTRCFYFYPGGWYDEHLISMTGDDTVMFNKTYKKLFQTNHHLPGTQYDSIYPTQFIGGWREEGQRVYFRSEFLCLDTIERLIYDFTATSPGDTLYTQLLSPGSVMKIPHLVTAIDSVLVGNAYHRRLQLTDENQFSYEEWIEGVGSNYGLIFASYWIVTDNSYDLLCFSEEQAISYQNPTPGFGYCTPPLPPDECEAIPTSTATTAAVELNFYPNPATTEVHVSTSFYAADQRLQITDAAGRIVFNQRLLIPQLTVNLSEFAPGSYRMILLREEVPVLMRHLVKM